MKPRPKFKVGDRVRLTPEARLKEWGFPESFVVTHVVTLAIGDQIVEGGAGLANQLHEDWLELAPSGLDQILELTK